MLFPLTEALRWSATPGRRPERLEREVGRPGFLHPWRTQSGSGVRWKFLAVVSRDCPGARLQGAPTGRAQLTHLGKEGKRSMSIEENVENGLITEEVGLDDGVAALRQLGLITRA